jgi:hypothetical protein
MKAMRKLLRLICAIGICCGFSSCTKENDNNGTVILLGREAYVVPMSEMIPDTLRDKFLMQMGNPPEGFIPPNIEGEYLISEKQFCHSNFVDLSDHEDMHLRVTNQHNRVANVEFHEGATVYTDTAFIMGSGQRFTIYMLEKRDMFFYSSYSMTRCVVITGEKTEGGIKDLWCGSIVLAADNGGDPFLGTFKPGWYFIYKDKDGMSENCHWFDDNPTE